LKTEAEALKKEFSKRINVEAISNQFWCEKQVELSLLHETEGVSEYRMRGRERHKELHKEVTDLYEIPEIKSKEDRVGVMLHNAIVGVLRLAHMGLTRELPVLGCIDQWFIKGVIDELKIKDGVIQLIERKTRMTDSIPTQAQILTHKIQGMIYYKLLSRLQDENIDYWQEIAEFYDLDVNAKMSDELLKMLVEKQLLRREEIKFEKDLKKKAKYFVSILKRLPPISPEILLIYESQKAGKEIGVIKVLFDEKWIEDKIKYAREYWEGKREALKVPETDKWKCRYCEFSEYCF